MRTQNSLFRLTASLAIASLLVGPALPAYAQGQPAPPPMPQPADTQTADPPSRVGRLARVSGTVSFHAADATQWEQATANYPVTSGNAYWTEPRAAADIEIGGSHIAMDQGSEFTIDTLDDHLVAATLGQGEIYLRLRDVLPGETYQFRTPRGVVTIAQPGTYALFAGNTERPTSVTVVEGLAQISGDNVSLAVRPRQTAQIEGTGPYRGVVVGQIADPFLAARLAADRPIPTGDYAPPPVVAQMTGGEALVETGSWQPTQEYGQVWYPPVEQGWVPYRQGHWAYVAPWGWTWIDNASWGFAPFHYGRWVEIGPRWGWVPVAPGIVVRDYRPVYSPALVAFIGLGVGAAIGASVGWIPLGPREAYHPPYRVSPNYLRQVNVTHVTNVTNITAINNNRYINRGGATLVPGSAMTGSQPIGPRAQGISPQLLATTRPLQQAPVQPNGRTAGITPGVARQLNIAPMPPGAAGGRQAAPGPSFQARPGFAPQTGSAPAASVPLRQAPGPVGAGPAGPGQGGTRPGGAAPGIPQPGPPRGPERGFGGPNQPGQPQQPLPQQFQPRPTPPIPVPGGVAPQFNRPQPGGPQPGGPQSGAPGPAISPRPQAAPGGQPLNPTQPALRPPASMQPGPTQPQPGPQHLPGAAAPGIPAGAAPGFQRPPPGPAPQPQAIQPQNLPRQGAPQAPQQPPPQVQRPAPPPQMQQAAPPAPAPRAPPQQPPVQRAAPPAPPPQMQHAAPPPQVQQAAPPPVQHAAPPQAPRPAPPPPAERRPCPPGRPTC